MARSAPAGRAAYIRQADDAYKVLAGQATADPKRLLVVGHSEGGMYPILVAEAVPTKPLGLALVEPQDERLLDQFAVQIDETLNSDAAQGVLTADEARRNDTGARQAIAAFRAGQPVDLSTLRLEVTAALAPIVATPANALVARTDDAIDRATYAAKPPRGTWVLVTDAPARTAHGRRPRGLPRCAARRSPR